MNLLTIDLELMFQREIVGPKNINLCHIGTWLKLVSYISRTDSGRECRILDAVEWDEEEWMCLVGVSRSSVLDENNAPVCADLWKTNRKHLEVYFVDVDEKTGALTGFSSYFTNYGLRRKLADEAIRSAALRKAVLAKTGGTCTFCGSDYDICVDHIVPVKHGGCNSIDNLQPLCRSCNSAKGAKIEYQTNVGMLLEKYEAERPGAP